MVEENPFCKHSPDPLENLSRYEGRCLVCGESFYETVVGESDKGWIACSCGHVFEAHQKNKWH